MAVDRHPGTFLLNNLVTSLKVASSGWWRGFALLGAVKGPLAVCYCAGSTLGGMVLQKAEHLGQLRKSEGRAAHCIPSGL